MGDKMEKGAGLTARQKQLLDLAVQEKYIVKTFYLSGGTALSYWYLHHRQSDDLDFFSLVPFDYERMIRWFRYHQVHIGYERIGFDEDYGFLMVHIVYPDQEILKIDMHYYSKSKLQTGIRWHGLEIDSLFDITVNKVQTIASHPRTRDYIDLYTILTNRQWVLDDLITKVEEKFHESIDPLRLAKNFLKVNEYTDFPKMLIPFNKKDMIRFYERLAGTLKSKILK